MWQSCSGAAQIAQFLEPRSTSADVSTRTEVCLCPELLADLQRVAALQREWACGFYYGRASLQEMGVLLRADGTCDHRHASDSDSGFCSPVLPGHWFLDDTEIVFDFGDYS